MKKLFTILAITLAAAMAFTSCKKDEADTNVLIIRGSKLPVTISLYAIYQDQVNFDVDAGPEATNLHGYGGFPASWIGKTTQLNGNFFLSFNPMQGASIDPVIKSGTVTITQIDDAHIKVVVDATETNGQPLALNCIAYDETKVDE